MRRLPILEILIPISTVLSSSSLAETKPICIPKKGLVIATDAQGCEHGHIRGEIAGMPIVFCKEPPDYKGPKTPEWDPNKGQPNDTPDAPKPDTPKPPREEPKPEEPPQDKPEQPEPEQPEPEQPEPEQPEPEQPEPEQPEPSNDIPSDGGGTSAPSADDMNCSNPLVGCSANEDRGPIIKVPPKGNVKDCSSLDVSCAPADNKGGLIKKPPFSRLPTLDCSDPKVDCGKIEIDNKPIPFCEDEGIGGSVPGHADDKVSIICLKNPSAPGCKDKKPSGDECKTRPWMPACQKKPADSISKPEICKTNPWLSSCNTEEAVLKPLPKLPGGGRTLPKFK